MRLISDFIEIVFPVCSPDSFQAKSSPTLAVFFLPTRSLLLEGLCLSILTCLLTPMCLHTHTFCPLPSSSFFRLSNLHQEGLHYFKALPPNARAIEAHTHTRTQCILHYIFHWFRSYPSFQHYHDYNKILMIICLKCPSFPLIYKYQNTRTMTPCLTNASLELFWSTINEWMNNEWMRSITMMP